MQKLFTKEEYIDQLYFIARQKNYYGYGAFGAPADYEYTGRSYEDNRQRYNAPHAPVGSFLFDCSGFAYKAIPWGFCADPTRCYGGAVVPAKGEPLSELNTNNILAICDDVSEDFSTIQPAEVLYLPGHVGIYVGNGLALECTSGWNEYRILETEVENIVEKGSLLSMYGRTWTKHGKLPFINYETNDNKVTEELDAAIKCLDGAMHELSCLDGILEDLAQTINNLKGVITK